MKTKIIYIAVTTILLFGCVDTKQKLGYEAEYENEVDIYVGDVKSTDVIRKWFDSYNARDLETVSSIEHDDVVLYAPNGMIINGSDEHTKLAEQFLSAYPNAKWEILWSISSDIAFNTKPSENWVTTCVTVSYGEGDEATTLQRIIDAQIVEGKIKLVYGYERTVSKEEAEQNKIQIYDSSITEIIDVNAEIEELADSIMIP